MVSASPRVGDTTQAPQRRSRPGRHIYKGEREVRFSRRKRSRSSIRLKPFVQYSYVRASLELLWRHPPYDRESWCLVARLPLWQGVAADPPALGLLHADHSFSKHPCFITFVRNVRQKLRPSLQILFDGGPPVFQFHVTIPRVLGNRAIALGDSHALLSWHVRVTSTSRKLVTLVC